MCLQGLYARAAADADISIYASGLDYNRCHGGVLLVTVFRKSCMFMAAMLRISSFARSHDRFWQNRSNSVSCSQQLVRSCSSSQK